MAAGALGLALALGLPLGLGCGDAPAGWKRVDSVDGAASVAVPAAFTESTERGALVLRGDGLTVTLHGAVARPRADVDRGLRAQLEALSGAVVTDESAEADEVRLGVIYAGAQRLQVALLEPGGVVHLAVFGPGPWTAERDGLARRIADSVSATAATRLR